jgi:hypothetical protein
MQSEAELRAIQHTLRVSVREGWLDNVVASIFAVHHSPDADLLEHSLNAGGDGGPRVPDVPRLTATLQGEMQAEMEEKLAKCKWSEDCIITYGSSCQTTTFQCQIACSTTILFSLFS